MKILGSALGWIMRLCFQVTHSYGLSIILFTLATKVILFPVSMLTQHNSIKMIRMMPEINALKIKYVDDKDKLSEEQLALYKKHHYNPFVSLIPLFLQIPLVLGLIYVVYHPLNYVLQIDSGIIGQLHTWLNAMTGSVWEENSYQLEIISRIHQALVPDTQNLSAAVSQIRDLNMTFMGIDLSLKPSLHFDRLLLIPIFAGLSAWLMCTVENRINVLQMTQSTLSKTAMTVFMISFSTYFAFLVPAGVGIYWISSNLFAIPSMILLNAVMPPKKYIDYNYLKKMNAERIEKEKQYQQYHSREKADYKRFSEEKNKELVFYSETNGYYKYYKGMIDYICQHSDVKIHYVTSDPKDRIFEDTRANICPYYVGSDRYLIPLFMKLECKICVMTMPDLEKYHIKRSRVQDDIEYVYAMHAMGSTAMTLRKGALDWYDTVFCPGIDTFNEIRDAEELYQTPKKRLVEAGYPLIDDLIRDYEAQSHEPNAIPKILIAPSWQPDNLIELCGEEILTRLADQPYQVVMRPHPQQMRNEPERILLLKEKFAEYKNIEIQTDFSSNSILTEADLLITDWSNISWEFAFVGLKPVLFVDTPMKVMNQEYEKIKTKPMNITLRNEIGKAVQPDQIENIAELIETMLHQKDAYREKIIQTRDAHLYNIGRSGALCGKYILKSLSGKL